MRGDRIAPGGPAGYLTSATCRECHTNEHATWQASYHRRMTQDADRSAVVADFDGTVLETGGERFTLRREGDEHWVAIEDLAEVEAARRSGSTSAPVQVRLSIVTGSHHMQVFWLPAGFGNAQLGFPFTWLVDDRRWAPRHSVFLRDPAAPPPAETWNMTCIRCHVTAGQPRPRPEREVFETRVGELGIACEACHGPGENHVGAMRAYVAAREANPATPKPVRREIVQPADLDHVRGSQVCGQCHGMKWFDRSEGWAEEGFRYRPGDDLEATTPIIRPGKKAEQPWLGEVLRKHPTLFDDFFWNDGMIRVSGRELNGLVESPCYQRGELSCFSCHSLHGYVKADDQLGKERDGDAACTACHAPVRYAVPAHTHHRPGGSGALCYNCHMPHTTYGLLGAIRQHRIERPNVAATVATGRPNACNLCHLDRTLAWTEARLREWYGQPAVELPAEAGEISAAVRWLLAGDAGQRALLAWHFGWEPALEVSGRDWTAPLLARLLDDPYPAVRYIADRSLRAPAVRAARPFDFNADASARRDEIEAARKVAASVVAGEPARRRAVLRTAEGRFDAAAEEAWLRRRDNRPVHLRE